MVKYEKGFYLICLLIILGLGLGMGLSMLEKNKSAKIKVIENDKPNINSWNGVAFVVEKWFEYNLKDPKSLEIIEVTEMKKANDGTFVQTVKYRTKNSFGGFNIEHRIFVFNKNKVISAN